MKIRYYGFLANVYKKKSVLLIRRLIGRDMATPGVYSGDNPGKGTSINREGHFALPALQAGDDGVSL